MQQAATSSSSTPPSVFTQLFHRSGDGSSGGPESEVPPRGRSGGADWADEGEAYLRHGRYDGPDLTGSDDEGAGDDGSGGPTALSICYWTPNGDRAQ